MNIIKSDVSGKVVLITGANGGLGMEACKALAKAGATVILACERDAELCVDTIKAAVPGAKVDAGPLLDLRYTESIRKFVDYVQSKYPKVHILINGAATGIPKPDKINGVSFIVQINYLGPYILTRLLEKTLITSGARVVHISSITHRFNTIANVNTFFYDPKIGYPMTKLGNIYFSFEMQRRLGPLGVTSVVADPGGVFTNIVYATPVMMTLFGPLYRAFFSFCYSPPSDGVSSVLHAATVPWEKEYKDQNGVPVAVTNDLRYYARGNFATSFICNGSPLTGFLLANVVYMLGTRVLTLVDWPLRRFSGGLLCSWVGPVKAARHTYDEEFAAQLWDKSADLALLPRQPTL